MKKENVYISTIFQDLISEVMEKNYRIKQLQDALQTKPLNLCNNCRKNIESGSWKDKSPMDSVDSAKVLTIKKDIFMMTKDYTNLTDSMKDNYK